MNPNERSTRVGLAALVSSAPLTGIAEIAADHGGEIYLVGGALRDALLERPVADLDIAVAGEFEGFVESFTKACGRRPAPIGDDWRDTCRIHWGGLQIDVARLLGTLAEDLAQRDFTINAMALPLGHATTSASPESIVDLHDGRADLKAGRIRMVSEAVLDEDPLRLLRAVRYRAILDGFEIDEQTLEAIEARAASIDRVAAERVQTEWACLLAAGRWVEGARIAYDLGLGERTLVPAISVDVAAAFSQAEGASSGDGEDAGRLAALLTEAVAADPDGLPRQLIDRRWPASLARRSALAASWACALATASPDSVVGWALEDSAAASIAAPLADAIAAARGEAAPDANENLRLYLRRAAEPPWVRGADLRGWGMEQGPELGAVLEQLARGQLERRWHPSEDARAWARERADRVAARESA